MNALEIAVAALKRVVDAGNHSAGYCGVCMEPCGGVTMCDCVRASWEPADVAKEAAEALVKIEAIPASPTNKALPDAVVQTLRTMLIKTDAVTNNPRLQTMLELDIVRAESAALRMVLIEFGVNDKDASGDMTKQDFETSLRVWGDHSNRAIERTVEFEDALQLFKADQELVMKAVSAWGAFDGFIVGGETFNGGAGARLVITGDTQLVIIMISLLANALINAAGVERPPITTYW